MIANNERTARRHRRRTGAVTVEFAICAPLLFLTFFASLEFARVNMIRQSVENAVYEGCRRGIVPGATADDVRAAAQGVLDSVLISSAQITVNPSVITDNTAELTVSVQVPINANSWVLPFFFNGKSVSGSITLVRERALNSTIM